MKQPCSHLDVWQIKQLFPVGGYVLLENFVTLMPQIDAPDRATCAELPCAIVNRISENREPCTLTLHALPILLHIRCFHVHAFDKYSAH